MNKKQIVIKKNIDAVAKFLKNSIDWLQKTDCGCCHFNLSYDLAIFCGWSEGFDPKDADIIHSKTEPVFGIVAAVKVRNDADCADFDFLTIPYDQKTGDCCDTNVLISPGQSARDFKRQARFLLDSFVEIANAQKKGLLTFE